VTWADRLLSLQLTWRDAADIVIVAIIIYNILALIRGTRAMQVSLGLMLLGSTFFLARAFDLPALEAISQQILFYLPFAVVVLFQHEIRRALAQVGGSPLTALFRRRQPKISYSIVLDACEILASKQIGALIAMEGAQTLRMYEEGAKALDAILSTELLVNIFTPGAPLHDGAVLVRGNRITAAGAFLPLSQGDPVPGHGTRHRAALGLSEESDALLIIVSEENGSIAVAREGVLREGLNRDTLLDAMKEHFGER
jgi:diadenylate cyclase